MPIESGGPARTALARRECLSLNFLTVDVMALSAEALKPDLKLGSRSSGGSEACRRSHNRMKTTWISDPRCDFWQLPQFEIEAD